jgi:hemerythrin-like domain-containing protein
MKASEVRRQAVAEHDALRVRLSHLDQAARQVLAGERTLLGALRLEGEALLKLLLEHIQWEDAQLGPALRRTDPAGAERAAQLAREHREQRELLEHTLRALQDQTRPTVVLARSLVDLVDLLQQEMAEEEASLLDERVLRDDPEGG